MNKRIKNRIKTCKHIFVPDRVFVIIRPTIQFGGNLFRYYSVFVGQITIVNDRWPFIIALVIIIVNENIFASVDHFCFVCTDILKIFETI